MVKKGSAALGVLLTLANPAYANLDVVTLPAKGDAWIQEAAATLVVGDVPNPMTGDVALWSAIMTDKGDFLQGVTENVQARYVVTSPSRPSLLEDGTNLGLQSVVCQSRTQLVHFCIHA
jgi:hypothetical protein